MTEQEKIEKTYEMLLENFLFGKLGVTKENYKKIEYDVFSGAHSFQELFLQKFMLYLHEISKIVFSVYTPEKDENIQDPEEFDYIIVNSIDDCPRARENLMWSFIQVYDIICKIPVTDEPTSNYYLEIFQETHTIGIHTLQLLHMYKEFQHQTGV